MTQVGKIINSFAPFFNEPIEAEDYVAGRYYGPSVQYNRVTGDNTVADALIYAPFVPFETHTFTDMAFYNTGAGDNGEKARMGIYSSSDGRPDSLMKEAAEVTLTAAAALRVAALSGGQELVRDTLYFLAFVADDAFGILTMGRLMDANSTWLTSPMLGSFGFDSYQIGGTEETRLIKETHAYGALPASATPNAGSGALMPFMLLEG
ncbi:MAG: hypothetical protein JRC86_00465 [Deltaproteobacteria bacterium]|nr:hypothetical protein [Deltaproteobacteria bacterium]